mgnify:FL=1
MKPADIVAYAQENKIPVAAITDVHSLSNVPDFLQRCAKAGIHGIAGMTIQITKNNAAFGEMVLLAKGGAGFAALRDFLAETGHVGEDSEYTPSRGIDIKDLLDGKFQKRLQHCVMLDGFPGSVGEALLREDKIDRQDVIAVKSWAENENGNMSKLRAQMNEGDYLPVKTPVAASPLAQAAAINADGGISDGNSVMPVIETTMGFAKDNRQVYQTMTWFKHYAKKYLAGLGDDAQINKMVMQRFSNCTLEAAGKPYKPSEPPFLGADYLKSRCRTPGVYKNVPAAEDLKFFQEGDEKFDPGLALNIDIKQRTWDAWENFKQFVPSDLHNEYVERIEKELGVVETCGYEPYFRNIFRQQEIAKKYGNHMMLRGSAVASMILHVNGLSPVNPIDESLLFERFLNVNRIEDPDVDIEVIDPAGMFQSLVRELPAGQMAYLSSDDGIGKTDDLLKLAKETMVNFYPLRDGQRAEVERAYNALMKPIEESAKKGFKVPKWGDWIEGQYKKMPANKRMPMMNELVKTAGDFMGPGLKSSVSKASMVIMPNGVSQYFPLLRAQGESSIEGDLPRIPQTKYNLLATGLIKYDLLSNRSFMRAMYAWEMAGLSVDSPLDVNDPSVKYIFDQQAFLGVNQVSGWVGAKIADTFKPQNFKELTALNALIRDGVGEAEQEVINQYLHFKQNPHLVNLHPVLEPILGETYGNLLYEEQLMLLFTEVAGLPWEEADRFRSGLKKGRTDIFEEFEPMFVFGAVNKHQVSQETAKEWFKPILDKRNKFVFNKAHATSYAHVGVRQCWLKGNVPAYFGAELFCDRNDKVKFRGEKVPLKMILDDWSKLFGKTPGQPQTAKDFVRAVGLILKREEKNPNSEYRRNMTTLKNEMEESLKAGHFDFSIPPGEGREHVQHYIDRVFKRLVETGYEPVKHGKKTTRQRRAQQESVKRKVKDGAAMTAEEMEIARELEKYEMKPPANRRNEKIDWKEKVMIGHLLEFFQSEGLISGFDVNVDKANAIDHYRFSIKNKNGNLEEMHVIGPSTDPVRAIMRNPEYSLSSGMWQGGKKDRSRTDSLDVAMQIINKTGAPGFNMKFLKSKRIEDTVWLPKDKMRQFESALSKFARSAKSELFDSDSGGIIATFMPAEPTSPVLTDLFSNDMNYGMKERDRLLNGTRFISLDELNAQMQGGDMVIGKVFADKWQEARGKQKAGRRAFTAPIVNYRKVDDETPIHQLPMIVNGHISPGGHQRFMWSSQKKRADKIDQGFTTRRLRGHIFGRTMPKADTLWLGEAAMDTMSFNELQFLIHDYNNRTGAQLPVAEQNCVSVKSAGGATDVISDMLGVQIKVLSKDKNGMAEKVDVTEVKKEAVITPFSPLEKKTTKAWFMSKESIHFLRESTKENVECRQKLMAIMKEVGMTQDEINQRLVGHDRGPKDSLSQSVSNIYRNMKGEHEIFLHDSNMETWLRGSDLGVEKNEDGSFNIGRIAITKVPVNKPMSEMTPEEKEQMAQRLKQKFEYISGAKSLGLALDNDGAGKRDAVNVYRLCQQIGVPTGSLMPDGGKVTHVIAGQSKEFSKKDHNDYLMAIKQLKNDKQFDAADALLVEYAGMLKMPKISVDTPKQEHATQAPRRTGT